MKYEDVKHYIEEEPKARERRNKDRALVNLLIRKYPELSAIEKSTLIKIVHDYNNADRYWRLILERFPELQGSDYNDKVPLEQKKELELGYEVGYYSDTKS